MQRWIGEGNRIKRQKYLKKPKHFQVLFNFPKVFQKVNPNYVLSPRRPCICAPSVVRYSHQVSETHHILFVAHPRHTAVFSFLPPFLFPPFPPFFLPSPSCSLFSHIQNTKNGKSLPPDTRQFSLQHFRPVIRKTNPNKLPLPFDLRLHIVANDQMNCSLPLSLT